MLTLHEPIRLKSARGLFTLSDRAMGTLAGNYNMTQSTLSPTDLMLLFSPQTEFPEDMGGSTAISIRQNSTDVRNITMSVVNNLLNTIAVNQHNDFTYQDRVYISSMLHQLGIENVQQFMQQVQLLRQENQSIAELLTLYRNDTVQHFAVSRTPGETRDHYESRHSTTRQVMADGSPYYLHNEIYHRLQTGDIYQELHAHQASPSMLNNFVNNNQLQLSEQLRVSAHLQLNELRNQVVSGSQMTLHHYQNSYETGELFPVPTTEQEVLQQAFTATLLSTVDNLFTQRFDAAYATNNSWTDVAEQLEQTAYNTLSRFESYHSGQSFTYNESAAYTQSRLAVYNTEAHLLRQLISEQQPVTEEPDETVRLAAAAPPNLEHRTAEQELPTEADDSEPATETQASTEQVTSRITELTRHLLEGTPPVASPTPHTPTVLEPLRELLQDEMSRQQTDEPQALPPRTPSQTAAQVQEITTNITQPVTEQIYSQLTKVLQQPTQSPTVEPNEPSAELLLTQLPAPEEEMDPEILVQKLDAIDRKNRETIVRLRERTEELRREVAPPKPADPAQIRADGLRALNEPEKLLAELRERPETSLQHAHSPEIEAALELASPETRYILEKVTQYMSDPKTNSAGMHIASPMELHLGVQEALQASRMVEQQAEHELLHATTPQVEQQAAQQVLHELTQQAAAARQRTDRPQEVQPVSIVHKSERQVVDEELLELLEQQKTSRTEVVKEHLDQVNVNTLRENTTTTLNQQIVTQSSEEITELVNRALTRQMGDISEKVYSQMERKLQLERSRRGRF